MYTKRDFDGIYYQNKDSIFRMCFMYLKDYQLAEDATQETFLKVYRKLHTFKNNSKISTWITAIAVNICKDKMKKKSYKEIPTEDTINTLTNNCDVDDKLTVTKAISNLDFPLREVIILFYYRELKAKEISQILSISENMVYHYIRKGKSQLKKMLREDYYGK